jgi:hypothetical protein
MKCVLILQIVSTMHMHSPVECYHARDHSHFVVLAKIEK